MGEEFQRVLWRSLLNFLLALVLVPKHLHLILMHYWLLHCMVMHNSLYKLSWKWLSSITKMGEIVRTCGDPMFGFGNWWQSLWTNGRLELYLKGLSIGFSWSPFIGFKESLWRRFSESSPCFGFVPKHLHLILLHHWLLHCMVMHNSLYKLSWKWLSSYQNGGDWKNMRCPHVWFW